MGRREGEPRGQLGLTPQQGTDPLILFSAGLDVVVVGGAAVVVVVVVVVAVVFVVVVDVAMNFCGPLCFGTYFAVRFCYPFVVPYSPTQSQNHQAGGVV